ncbi:twin-arginine translocation signal domain-containing protein [Vibrio cincinnatiensis]|uniref:Formate dehydrogenase region TAT target n=1 Tax=Vibrio cincinnatiensis DSM 19608 TaxID=1123491 RepID=A0A1T4RL74_VIBCI|nr:twin-arginine translocation signal domain-containing protein [Vibrio cincinnatiensis]MCG3721349.1 twin-arginine translocation signal domain-containing protein [Vibrio cincinnatiensis]MCG3725601.1 twin-arginine translocation signal domain-containing protein [Vibrio cincinnatiensis]MCG3732075.1 twin-arginine translocation signal domain-containing protein [Vibrio cincinnatiensis]MCG3736243.1 twin-arginine translocation signal domain-containing protein [Vibrio cincinnatiensis]MCG3739786.1 twin-
MKKEQPTNTSRRDMLKSLAAATVAGGVIATVGQSAVAAEPQPESQPKLKKGYHETQHIRDYYDTL